MSEQDAGAADNAAAEETTTPSMDETMAAAFDRLESSERDEGTKGTNTEGAGIGDTEGTDADNGAGKDSTDQTASNQAPGAETPTDAPNSWSAEDKAIFAKAPPEIQSAILKREAERDNLLTTKTQEIANERRTYEGIKSVVAPIEAAARKNNLTADVAIQQMFDRHLDIAQNGIEGLKRVAAIYGLTLTGGAPETEYTDPETAALRSELQSVKSTVTNWQQQQAQQREAAVNSEIDSVRLEKAKDGSLVRPHFDALFDDMIPLAQAIRTKNPSWTPSKVATEAYERASRANPEVWGKLEAERIAKEKAATEKAAKEAAALALKSAGNNTRGSTAHPGSRASGKSMDETMSKVYDRMSAA